MPTYHKSIGSEKGSAHLLLKVRKSFTAVAVQNDGARWKLFHEYTFWAWRLPGGRCVELLEKEEIGIKNRNPQSEGAFFVPIVMIMFIHNDLSTRIHSFRRFI